MTNPDMKKTLETIKDEAKAILRDRGINPATPAAYEVWFRRFDDDGNGVIQEVADTGDILAWLYDTAELAAEPDTLYTDPAARRIARKLIKQFA